MKIDKKDIEKIILKNFNKVNKEGLGFLNTEINKCIEDLYILVNKSIFISDDLLATKGVKKIQDAEDVLTQLVMLREIYNLHYSEIVKRCPYCNEILEKFETLELLEKKQKEKNDEL